MIAKNLISILRYVDYNISKLIGKIRSKDSRSRNRFKINSLKISKYSKWYSNKRVWSSG